MSAPARKAAPVVLSSALLAFARAEGPLARLARESGRGNAYFGLDQRGRVVRTESTLVKYEEHASYPMSTRCPACGDPGIASAKPGEPGSATGPCINPRCALPALSFPHRRST